jgi:hypothetical protein
MPTIMRLDRQAASIALCTEVARKAVLVLEDGTVIESRSPSCRGLVPQQRRLQLHHQKPAFLLRIVSAMTRWEEGGTLWQARPAPRVGSFLMATTRPVNCVVASPGPSRSPWPGGSRRLLTRVQFANSVQMAPRSWELIALSLLAGLGFGLALARGDLIFVAVFGAACAMATIGGMQRFP